MSLNKTNLPITKKAEHLIIDPPIEIKCKGCDKLMFLQKYVLVSFVSPEDDIKKRFVYEACQFLHHDVNKQIVDTTINIARNINAEFNKIVDKKITAYKSSDNPLYKEVANFLTDAKKEFTISEDEQVSKVMRSYLIDYDELNDRFETYKSQNYKELEEKFVALCGDKTSIRGIKVRGVYEDYADCTARADYLRNNVESGSHIFIFPVGYWVPWDPNADSIQNQEYMIDKLNDMVKARDDNAKQRDEVFGKRVQDAKDQNARKDRLKTALKDRIKEKEDQRKPK